MTYPLAATLLAALWAGLLAAMWDDGSGFAVNAAGAAIAALIAYLPAMYLLGGLWRLAECALSRWRHPAS